MIDTAWMRSVAEAATNKDVDFPDVGVIAQALRDAADEIDAGRNARLVQYRCATASGLLADPSVNGNHQTLANRIEAFAHAMLAAERAPEVKS